MSNDQVKALRCADTMMKEKWLKYDMQVRRNPIFPIATVLDLRFKLRHIPHGDHNVVTETLLNMLQSECFVKASRFMTD